MKCIHNIKNVFKQKKHSSSACQLKKLYGFGNLYENIFINIFSKNSSKKLRNNNLDIKWYANKIPDIIQLQLRKTK